MDKVIEIANRAVADYGFRQAVLYGVDDIARRWDLTVDERAEIASRWSDDEYRRGRGRTRSTG